MGGDQSAASRFQKFIAIEMMMMMMMMIVIVNIILMLICADRNVGDQTFQPGPLGFVPVALTGADAPVIVISFITGVIRLQPADRGAFCVLV